MSWSAPITGSAVSATEYLDNSIKVIKLEITAGSSVPGNWVALDSEIKNGHLVQVVQVPHTTAMTANWDLFMYAIPVGYTGETSPYATVITPFVFRSLNMSATTTQVFGFPTNDGTRYTDKAFFCGNLLLKGLVCGTSKRCTLYIYYR